MKILVFSLFITLIVGTGCIQLASDINFSVDKSKTFKREIRMQNGRMTEKEAKRCTAVELGEDLEFITEIEIFGVKEVNHHMTITACQRLPDPLDIMLQEDSNSWDAKRFGICGRGKSRRLYTWALDADGIKFEKGVGMKVGGDTNLNYIVLQVHYNDKVPIGYVDNKSAYVVTFTTQPMKYQVGVYTLGDDGKIPPKEKAFHLDAGCELKFDYDIVPIAYRTHAHNIIRVISGYAIIDGEWVEVGRMSPKQPQQFYPATNENLVLRRGDWLASRCTADSMKKDKFTFTGQKHEDEMCVFYMLFYTDYMGNLEDEYCWKMENDFIWEYDMPFARESIPKNNDKLDGVHLRFPAYELL